MTDKQILQKAIEKAEKNGYKGIVYPVMYYNTIFKHDFAKAFWVYPAIEKPSCEYCEKCSLFNKFGWKSHLQQMVLEKEPLQYLRRFLD